MTLNEYFAGFGVHGLHLFKTGEFVIFKNGKGIIRRKNSWCESLSDVKSAKDWNKATPITKPLSSYMRRTVINIDNYDNR